MIRVNTRFRLYQSRLLFKLYGNNLHPIKALSCLSGTSKQQLPQVLPDAWNTPSAPSADASSATPTAPSDPAPALELGGQTPRGGVHANAESECCICLDKAPCVAFLPCGHVCCCAECGIVSVCPMCRAQITTTVRLYFTQT